MPSRDVAHGWPARRGRTGLTKPASLGRAALLGAAALGFLVAGCGGDFGGDDGPPERLDADVLTEECFEGEMRACDELAALLPPQTDLWVYARTCAARVARPAGGCEARFPSVPDPPSEDVEALPSTGLQRAEACETGDLGACDELAGVEAAASELPQYGRTCGGRIEPVESCTETLADLAAAGDLPAPAPVAGVDLPLRDTLLVAAEACLGGDREACDRLRNEAPDALYDGHEELGATCGRRRAASPTACIQDPTVARLPNPKSPEGIEDETEVALRDIALECGDDDYASCVALTEHPGAARYPAFAEYGRSCGGKAPGERPESCLAAFARGQQTDSERNGGNDVSPPAPSPTPPGGTPPPPAPPPSPPPSPTHTVVIPTGPPPEPETPRDLPGEPPSAEQIALFDAVEEALNRRNASLYRLEHEDMRVGRSSMFSVVLREAVPVSIPGPARRSARGKPVISIQADVVPESRPLNAITFGGIRKRTFDLRVAQGTLVLLGRNKRLGPFSADPSEPGERELFLRLTNLRIDGKPVAHELRPRLRVIDVADRPLWEKLWAQALAIAALLSAVETIFKPFRRGFRRLRPRSNAGA